jgi:hypothetical protein
MKIKCDHSNGVVFSPITENEIAGFIVKGGNTTELRHLVDTLFKEVGSFSDADPAKNYLEVMKSEITELGYTCGDIEVKSYNEWLIEAFGSASDQDRSVKITFDTVKKFLTTLIRRVIA